MQWHEQTWDGIKPSNIGCVREKPELADIGLVAEVPETRRCVGTEGFLPPEGPATAQARAPGSLWRPRAPT